MTIFGNHDHIWKTCLYLVIDRFLSMAIFGRHDHIWKTWPNLENTSLYGIWTNFGVWPYLEDITIFGKHVLTLNFDKIWGRTMLEIYDTIFIRLWKICHSFKWYLIVDPSNRHWYFSIRNSKLALDYFSRTYFHLFTFQTAMVPCNKRFNCKWAMIWHHFSRYIPEVNTMAICLEKDLYFWGKTSIFDIFSQISGNIL